MRFFVTDSFVLLQGQCVNFKAMRYDSTSFSRIVAGKSQRVTLALEFRGLCEKIARLVFVTQVCRQMTFTEILSNSF